MIELRIGGYSEKEVRRQLELYKPLETKDYPLHKGDPMEVVLEGGREILEDKETLKLVRSIYKGINRK